MNPSEAAVVVLNLKRNFGPVEVLRDINFSVRRGEIVALKGPNGSGKTTLLRILATLTAPSSGEVRLLGVSIREERAVRRLIGWVPASDCGFLPRLTGEQNLFFFGSLYGLKANQVEAALSKLENFEPLTQALQTPFYLCSAGMKQALLVARALLHDPELLILDEPTRSLDDEACKVFCEYLRVRDATKTVIFSTHNGPLASTLAHRILHLEQGEIHV